MSEKRYDGIKALSEVSGLSESVVKTMWEDVKKNHHRLDSCIGHVFNVVDPDDTWNRRYKCVVCGGVVDSFAYGWYVKGLEHGKRQAKP